VVAAGLGGCVPTTRQRGEGPGHRAQNLALTPAQELSLGRQAYEEILGKARQAGTLLPENSEEVRRVKEVGERIVAQGVNNEPLQREINLAVKNYYFEWRFNVIRENQVNAFCLPAGKVVVYTGLLDMVRRSDKPKDWLATVLGHEIAHALAHHASERLAREGMFHRAVEAAVNRTLGGMNPETRKRLIGLLAGGADIFGRAYDRKQESEADHIGVFLMTFAEYDPDQAIRFWDTMRKLSEGRRRPPEILSTHPSDAVRVQQLRRWVPYAKAAYRTYKEGKYIK
jgi:predicted Zn-dependent protease